MMLSKRSKNQQNLTIFLGRHIWIANCKEQRKDDHKSQNSGFLGAGIKALIREGHDGEEAGFHDPAVFYFQLHGGT